MCTVAVGFLLSAFLVHICDWQMGVQIVYCVYAFGAWCFSAESFNCQTIYSFMGDHNEHIKVSIDFELLQKKRL